MTLSARRAASVLFTCFALTGCVEEASPDGIDEVGVIPGGKADGSDYSACELSAVVSYLNAGISADELRAAAVHSRAATNVTAHRDGADGTFGTDDDDLFDDIDEVDAVSWVGPAAIRQLVAAAEGRCTVEAGETEVIFSPQEYDASHLARIAELINGSNRSIDIAMYSFRDSTILSALNQAVDRGVTVRMIFQSASDDRSDPEGTTSGNLEEMGIEVRYVNKIMHHKFAIFDGARTDLSHAADGILATGSGNWSNSAATRFDENTLIVHGNVELNLRYQREFNHLWDWSRPVVWNEDIVDVPDLDITDADIPDDPSVDAAFTSANFSTSVSSRYGPTFSVIRGENEVSDTWVSLIMSATRSIRIASGHLRSRPVAEALVAAHEANPDLDIRIYLDNQEYISEYTHDQQESELATCLAAATSVSQEQDCTDRGFLFGYAMHVAGLGVRYKYYAYRWDYSYADQMHDKYMVIDEDVVLTGSYNLSDNAEHNTMENVSILRGEAYRSVIDAYIDNFDALWVTGEEEGLYPAFLDEVVNGTGSFPIVFTPMALDWDQVTELKQAIRDACPDINSTEFRTNAAAHRYCSR